MYTGVYTHIYTYIVSCGYIYIYIYTYCCAYIDIHMHMILAHMHTFIILCTQLARLCFLSIFTYARMLMGMTTFWITDLHAYIHTCTHERIRTWIMPNSFLTVQALARMMWMACMLAIAKVPLYSCLFSCAYAYALLWHTRSRLQKISMDPCMFLSVCMHACVRPWHVWHAYWK
jgi:hypothetical protein